MSLLKKGEEIPPLQTSIWADPQDNGTLRVDRSRCSIQMKNSHGIGQPLVLCDRFGADVISFSGGEGVGNHTHQGSHILFVLSGTGTLVYSGERHGLYPGLCYMVPEFVEHAIEAETDLVLIAVGNYHFPLDSVERMTPVSEPIFPSSTSH